MRFLIKSEVSQVVLTYMFGILSYVIAQLFDMSGVITVLICGVTLAHYNFYNLSPGGMHATSYLFIYPASAYNLQHSQPSPLCLSTSESQSYTISKVTSSLYLFQDCSFLSASQPEQCPSSAFLSYFESLIKIGQLTTANYQW